MLLLDHTIDNAGFVTFVLKEINAHFPPLQIKSFLPFSLHLNFGAGVKRRRRARQLIGIKHLEFKRLLFV